MDQETKINYKPNSSPLLGSKGKNHISEPLLLMDMDENGKFIVSKRAMKFLSEIDTNLAIIGIVGPYRTGKSFLLNRFAGQQKGFALGPSTNPCTKGIWIWGQPIKINDNLSVLLLDTEGLHSYERDENFDAKLFVLTALLSSTLLYNVMNVIDERAIENLSFMTQMSKLISKDDDQFLPNFVWVIRDFGLEFKNTDNHNPALVYMENALRLLEGNSEEIRSKNDIRMAILRYFKKRDCFTLVRPVIDEQQLRIVDQLNYVDLRKDFRAQVEDLTKNIIGMARPKIICDAPVRGKHLVDLIGSYVMTMNSQGIPSIISAWDRIIEKEYRKLIEKINDKIQKYIVEELQENLPMETENLIKIIGRQYASCQDEIIRFSLSREKQTEALLHLRNQFNDLTNSQLQENYLKSKKMNSLISNKMIEVLNKASEIQKYQNVQTIIKESQNLKKIYFQEAQAPSSYEVYSIMFFDNVLRIIERVYNNVKIEEQQKIDELNQTISKLTAKNETLLQLLQNEKDTLNKQLDSLRRTLDDEREFQEKRFLELQSLYQKKNEQDRKWRHQISEQSTNLFANPDAFIQNKDMEQREIMKDLGEQVKSFQEKLIQIQETMSNVNSDKLELQYQQKLQEAIKEVKKEYEVQLDRMKLSFEAETRVLKQDRQRLDEVREQLQIAIVERDCQLKLLKEKIKSNEKQKTKEIEHADMMCKISEQLLKVMRKIDNR